MTRVGLRLSATSLVREEAGGPVLEVLGERILLRQAAREPLTALLDGRGHKDELSSWLLKQHAVCRSDCPDCALVDNLLHWLQSEGYVWRGRRYRQLSQSVGRHVVAFATHSSDDRPTVGRGVSRDACRAVLIAVVEAFERISCDRARQCASRNRPGEGHTIIPVQYTDWQRADARFPFGEGLPSGSWRSVWRPADRSSRAAVPDELVVFGRGVSRQRVGAASSNGVAAHIEPSRALMVSAWELVERDAMMVHWFGERPGRRIPVPESCAHAVAALGAAGFETRLVALDAAIGYCHAALAVDPTGIASHCLGLAAGSRPDDVAEKAVLDLATTVLTDLRLAEQCRPALEIEQVKSPEDHREYYRPRSRRGHLCFLASSPVTELPPSEAPATVSEMNRAFELAGHTWWATQLNASAFAQTGVAVFRSIVEGLVPLTFGAFSEPLGLARLRSNARLPSRCTRSGYLPHPLA